MTIPIQCPQCCSTEFEKKENSLETDFVKCHLCGHHIMLEDLKEVGVEQAKEIAINMAKKEMEKMVKDFAKRFNKK